jgi:hypothetical protein
MTTGTVTMDDLDHLRRVMGDLTEAGRTEELAALARIHAAVQEMLCRELFDDHNEDDPELRTALEEADRDFAAGRGIAHAEVVRRLAQLGDG